MIFVTHMVIATAVTKGVARSHPALAVIIALASHYLLDTIPHWAYESESLVGDEKEHIEFRPANGAFRRDTIKALLDVTLGAVLSLLIFWPRSSADLFVISGILAASILPDFLQVLYHYFQKPSWLKPHQNFHDWIHTKLKLDPYPLIGIPFQILIILLFVWIF